MPEIGAKRSIPKDSRVVIEFQELYPAFLRQAKDARRPIVHGYCIDNPKAKILEQAVGYNPIANQIELHVIDTTSIPALSELGKTALNNRDKSYNVFNQAMIPVRMHLGSLDEIDESEYTPSITYALDESENLSVFESRVKIIDRFDFNDPFHLVDKESKPYLFRALTITDADTELYKLEAQLTAKVGEKLQQKYVDTIFELRGVSPKIHRPMRNSDDYYNQQIDAYLRKGSITDALKMTGRFEEDHTVGLLVKSVGYLTLVAEGMHIGTKIEGNDFNDLVDYWDNPSELAEESVRFLVNFGSSIPDDIPIEQQVVESLQTINRQDPPSTKTLKNVLKNYGFVSKILTNRNKRR